MRLWTIQPPEVYDLIIKTGQYTCDETKSDNIVDLKFEKAYDWLVSQMDKRGIVHPEGIKYPVWAWHTMAWKHKKPDLRLNTYGRKGEKLVLLEVEIPDEDVLLHDYDDWHMVLNDWYNDNSKNEEEYDKKQEWYGKLSPEEKITEKEKSWEDIFELTPFENEWRCKAKYIQATFWILKKENIKKVQFFTIR